MTHATMASVLAGGATYRGLGEVLDASPDTARMRARRAGLRSLHRKRPPHAETHRRVQVARQMRAEVHEWAAIAERLGMRPAAVRMMLRRART